MKLNKRYARSVRANLPFYIAASLLTTVTLLMFFLFYIAGTGINSFGDEMFSDCRLEDATFTTYSEIPDGGILSLERKYDVSLEKERFAGVDDGRLRVRVFSPTRRIDLFRLQTGHSPSSDDEILISAGYAEENNVKTGDRFTINGRSYRIAGTFLRPDYLYMVENLSDDYKNVTDFLLAYMTPAEFERQFGGGSVNYKVIYGKNTDQAAFRRQVNENYFMSGYLAADSNKRVTFVHEQADMFILSAWFILAIFPLLTVALVCILLGRRIRSEQKLIGTLSAMRYSKGRLMRHYSLFALIPGIVGGLLTSAAAILLAEPFGSLGLADYEPMKPAFTLPLWVAVSGVVIPSLIYYVSAMLRVKNLLREDTVKLLAAQADIGSGNRRVLVRTNAPVRRKFAVRQLVGSPGRSFVVFLGIFLGAVIVAFAFSFVDSVRAVGNQAHGEFGSFEYEYVLNSLRTGKPWNGEAVLALPFEDSDGRRFSVMGLDSSTRLWNLTTTDGVRADIDNGFYISTLCEAVFGLHKGDSFTFRSITTLEEHTVRIDGIIRNGYQSYLISSREKAADIMGLKASDYNAVLSAIPLDYRSDEVTGIISDKTYQTQMDNLLTAMDGLIDAFMIIGMIVCIASLYATINTIISENSHNISMLKVLGYENSRINRMVLSSNHLLLLPGIALGTLAAYGIMAWYCAAFVEVESIMIPATLRPESIVLTAVITAASYFIPLLLLRRKVDRTDMIAALKDERE